MLIGILIAAVFSLLETALRAASPQTAVLGRLPGTDTYRRLRRSPDAETIPGLVIFRLDAPLFFVNANHFREGVIRAVGAAPEPVTELLVDAEAMCEHFGFFSAWKLCNWRTADSRRRSTASSKVENGSARACNSCRGEKSE